MSSSPAQEPTASDAAEQMREVVDRLRGQAWMVAPITSASPEQPDHLDSDCA